MPLLWSPDECVRYPLVLAYVDDRFIPLVGGDGTTDLPSALDIVPLVKAQLEPLPLWFLLSDEENEAYSMMQRYMNVTEVNLCQADSINMVLGARLRYQKLETAASRSAGRTAITLLPAEAHFQDARPAELSINSLPEILSPVGIITGTASRQQGINVINHFIVQPKINFYLHSKSSKSVPSHSTCFFSSSFWLLYLMWPVLTVLGLLDLD